MNENMHGGPHKSLIWVCILSKFCYFKIIDENTHGGSTKITYINQHIIFMVYWNNVFTLVGLFLNNSMNLFLYKQILCRNCVYICDLNIMWTNLLYKSYCKMPCSKESLFCTAAFRCFTWKIPYFLIIFFIP